MLVYRSLAARHNEPIALTIGNFDGVHVGHQSLLEQLKSCAEAKGLKTAVMVFEPHPLEFLTPHKAPTRLTSLREKLELFAKLGIDYVYVCAFNAQFAQIAPADFVQTLYQQINTHFILIGDDFRFGSKRAGDFNLLQTMGQGLGFDAQALNTILFDGVRISSTAVREALAQGELNKAAAYLGRHYSISGRVSPGDKLGRELGYPTANISLKHNRPPLMGIYVVQCHIQDIGLVKGVASIGVRPTVKENAKPLLEVHLFDFNQQIYSKHMRVEFLHKLRDELKFDNLADLVAQIELDALAAKHWWLST